MMMMMMWVFGRWLRSSSSSLCVSRSHPSVFALSPSSSASPSRVSTSSAASPSRVSTSSSSSASPSRVSTSSASPSLVSTSSSSASPSRVSTSSSSSASPSLVSTSSSASPSRVSTSSSSSASPSRVSTSSSASPSLVSTSSSASPSLVSTSSSSSASPSRVSTSSSSASPSRVSTSSSSASPSRVSTSSSSSAPPSRVSTSSSSALPASFFTSSLAPPLSSFVEKPRRAAATLRNSRRPGSPTAFSIFTTSTIRSPPFSNRSNDRCCSSSNHSCLRAPEQWFKSHHVLTSGPPRGPPVPSWFFCWRGAAGDPHSSAQAEDSRGSSTRGEGEQKGAAPETRAPCNPTKENIFSELYENPWTVPNALCVTRIALSPVIACLVSAEEFSLALGVLSLAGLTDLLDGFIARTWPSQQSALGSALDPLADKILISVLYVSLTCAHLIPVPLTALIISRDIALIGAVFYVRYRTVPPPRTLARYFNPRFATAQLKPTLISKVNTAMQLFLVAVSLTAPVLHFTDSSLLVALWYMTALTTVGSGYTYYHYGRQTIRVLNGTK